MGFVSFSKAFTFVAPKSKINNLDSKTPNTKRPLSKKKKKRELKKIFIIKLFFYKNTQLRL